MITFSLPALARKASDLIIIDVDGFIDSQRTARSFFLTSGVAQKYRYISRM
jgi:hypothetical protein